MISFELARELKKAGFHPSTSPYAVYCLNEDLRIRREQALHMWYGSKTKEGVPLELEQEAVFAPSLSELVIACGKPLQLSCDEAGHWQARKTVFHELVADGETAEEALARLWLLLENETS
jgi:hypothetical protein